MLARSMLASLALAGLFGVSYALPHQGQAPKCDVKVVEKAYFCDTCAKFLETGDVDTGKNIHKGTTHAVKLLDACVKTQVRCAQPGCAMTWAKGEATPGSCKEHKTTEEVVKARQLYRCGECGATASTAGDVKHSKADCKGKVEKTCEKSGTKPHVSA